MHLIAFDKRGLPHFLAAMQCIWSEKDLALEEDQIPNPDFELI